VPPTVGPATTDPYYNPDDRYTPRPQQSSSATQEPAGDAVVVSASDDGTYLVGPNDMTLYTFDEDDENVSNCNGGCAAAWPPLGADEGQAAQGGPGVDGDFAVIHRDDESHQVTYNGAPLYYYSSDQEPGDTTGDGVNGTWHLATP
jgi:predicted lipoprotein with Yx(FWY)xxD motif